ncbi:hypothetical protein ACLQ3C_18020 [Gordonia sp. DT30]
MTHELFSHPYEATGESPLPTDAPMSVHLTFSDSTEARRAGEHRSTE